MMNKLNVLFLFLFAMLLTGCSGVSQPPPIVKNEVPQSLLQCESEPEKPSFDTGNNAQDFKNIVIYTARVKNAGADCRSKLNRTRELITDNQQN